MKNKCPIILLSLLIYLLPVNVMAQQYLFDAELLTTEDGLASSWTYTIFKDSNGFLWVSTKYGLHRYDGYSFELFNKEQNGLHANHKIKAIAEDEEGNLWLNYWTDDKIFSEVFNPVNGKVTSFENYFGNQLPFASDNILNLGYIAAKNTIWIYTKKGEVYFYQKKQFKKIIEGLPSKELAEFNEVVLDGKNNIWIGCYEKILCISQTGEILESLSPPNQDKFIGIEIVENNQLWCRTGEHYNAPSIIWIKDKNKLNPLVLKKNKTHLKQPRHIIRGNNGFSYAQIDNQLHVFDENGIWLYDFNTLFGDNIKIETFASLEIDGMMWIATSSGLLKINIREAPFHLIQDNTVSADYRGIIEDESDNIYFLSKYLHRWNPVTNVTQVFPNYRGTLGMFYEDNSIWISAYSHDYLVTQLYTEIIYATGFSSPSHFTRTFKKAYGITPSEQTKHF